MTLTDVITVTLLAYSVALVLTALSLFFGHYQSGQYHGRWHTLIVYPVLLITSICLATTMGYVSDEAPAIDQAVSGAFHVMIGATVWVGLMLVIACIFKIKTAKR